MLADLEMELEASSGSREIPLFAPLLLEFLGATEEEPAFIGTSSHFLAIGCK
jgi:nitrate reductase assembly molybdenum cofactor insertion protein NarJ